MESLNNNMPSSLVIEAFNPQPQNQSIPDHLEDVPKVDDCVRELVAAVRRLIQGTEHARKAEQDQIEMQKQLRMLELEHAAALHRIHEMEEKYLSLEAITMEKEEQIRQNWQALQTAAESNSKLEQGRELAIAVAEQTQRTAKACELWAKDEIGKAFQSSAAALDRAKRAEEESGLVVSRLRQSCNARELAEERAANEERSRHQAEQRAQEAEMARNDAEKRAEKAEKARQDKERCAEEAERARREAEKAKALVEKQIEELEKNRVRVITSSSKAEVHSRQAEADLALATEKEAAVEQQVTTSAPVRYPTVIRTSLKRHNKEYFAPNKRSRTSKVAPKDGAAPQSPGIIWYDKRLQYLARDLDRVVDSWEAQEVRYALFTFSADSVEADEVERVCEITESSHLVRCVRHSEEVMVTIFDVLSLARKVYLANLDLKTVERLLRASIAQTVSRRHAQKFNVDDETKTVTLFLWTDFAVILDKIAEVYHVKDVITVSV